MPMQCPFNVSITWAQEMMKDGPNETSLKAYAKSHPKTNTSVMLRLYGKSCCGKIERTSLSRWRKLVNEWCSSWIKSHHSPWIFYSYYVAFGERNITLPPIQRAIVWYSTKRGGHTIWRMYRSRGNSLVKRICVTPLCDEKEEVKRVPYRDTLCWWEVICTKVLTCLDRKSKDKF